MVSRIGALLCCFLILSGCASTQRYSENSVISVLNAGSLQGKTFAIFPLDHEKESRIETEALAAEISHGLQKRGMRQVDPKKEFVQVFFVFDYAAELGISAEFEHAFLLIGYDLTTTKLRQVYRGKLRVDTTEKDRVKSFMNLAKKLADSFPASP